MLNESLESDSRPGRRLIDEVITTQTLYARPRRSPDFERESRALRELVRALADDPETILQKLVDKAVELCGAGSAGISIYECENGDEVFRWRAVAGTMGPYLNGTTPRHDSPCGVVVDRGAIQLMELPARAFSWIDEIDVPVHELLLVPFFRKNIPVGTIWVLSHSPDVVFDAEHGRLLQSLAEFTSAAVQTHQNLLAEIAVRRKFETAVVELRESEIRRNESEAQLSTAISIAKIGFYDWDIVRNRVTCSPLMRADWGLDVNVRLEDAVERLHPDDRDATLELIARSMETGNPFHAEYRVVRLTGEIIWIEAKGRVTYDENRRPIRLFGTAVNITERKAAAAELAEERHKLESMFTSSPAAMAFWKGRELIFEKVNSEYQSIFAGRQLVGKRLDEALPELAGQPFARLLSEVYRTGRPYNGREVMAQLATGPNGEVETKYFDFSYVRINDVAGQPAGVYDHAVDVTDRVMARRKVEESEARFKQLADSLPQIIWTSPADGIVDYCNARWDQFVGERPQKDYAREWREIVHPEDMQAATEAWRRCAETGETFQREVRLWDRAEGGYRWFLSRSIPLRDAAGEITKWIGSTTDIDKQKRAEDQIVDILESMNDAFLSLDRNWKITRVNAKQEAMSHSPRDQQRGRDFRELPMSGYHDPGSDYWHKYQKAMETRSPAYFEAFYPEPERWAAVNVYPTPDGGLAVFYRDITEQKIAADQLKASEIRFRQLADAMPQIVYTARPDGYVDYCNRRWYELTGTEPGATGGPNWDPQLRPEDAEGIAMEWRRCIASEKPYQIELLLLDATSGEYRCHLSRGVPVRDARGHVVKWFGTMTDIHDLKRAQQELTRSNSELARFAFVASHDLKEPVRTVSNFTQLLERSLGDRLNETERGYVRYIVDGGKRMFELINDLLSYSRIGAEASQLEKLDLDTICGLALENLASAVADSRATVHVEPLPKIVADPSQTLQLFQNIIGNAIKYRADRPPVITVSASERKDEWLFKIQDNGIGIGPEFYEKIFVLFQRLHAKDKYSGTGIGLAVCKRIVENHGGKIWVESEVGRGTAFYFTLQKIERNPE